MIIFTHFIETRMKRFNSNITLNNQSMYLINRIDHSSALSGQAKIIKSIYLFRFLFTSLNGRLNVLPTLSKSHLLFEVTFIGRFISNCNSYLEKKKFNIKRIKRFAPKERYTVNICSFGSVPNYYNG